MVFEISNLIDLTNRGSLETQSMVFLENSFSNISFKMLALFFQKKSKAIIRLKLNFLGENKKCCVKEESGEDEILD